MKSIALLLAPLALVFAGCATAKAPTAEQAAPLKVIKTNASMPFANLHRQIDNWTVRTDGSLLIEASNGKFYHATFFAPCVALDFETQIGFKANTTGDLDKFSSITLPHDRTCQFNTFDEVADPRAPAPPAAPPPT